LEKIEYVVLKVSGVRKETAAPKKWDNSRGLIFDSANYDTSRKDDGGGKAPSIGGLPSGGSESERTANIPWIFTLMTLRIAGDDQREASMMFTRLAYQLSAGTFEN
jgi:hypothetical protein